MKKFLILMAAIWVAACANVDSSTSNIAIERARTLASSAHDVRNFLADTTFKTYNRQHGTQMEYLSAEGESVLVYPGNKGPVRGRWKVGGGDTAGTQMCFMYGPQSYNPVTKQYGGKWECRGMVSFLLGLDELYDGDPLRLKNARRLLATMPRGLNVSILTATQAVAFDPPKGPNKAPRAN